ncbi:MAG TPA: hypothetical protein VFN48_03660 [Solirubrobacteraceae bacterium]|nr:hypothetical protein [Solirubrobacteraceae bacterium]
MVRSARAALAGLVLMLGLAACGGSGSPAKVTPTAYVSALCRAVAPFERDVATASSHLTGAASQSLTASRDRLVSYLGALAQDSATAQHRLSAAGVPDVKDGAAFASTIVSTFSRLHNAFARSVKVASGLPTTNRAAFSVGATQLATAVKESVGQLGAGLSTRSNPVLDRTAAKLAVCHTL